MTSNRLPLRHVLAVLALGCLAATAPSQEPKPTPSAERPAPLSEWPAAKPAETDRLPALVGQLKKDKDELKKGGRDGLIAIGPAAAPFLFQQVNDKDEAFNGQLFAVLDAILAPQHAALMARETRKNKPHLRRYLMQRLCRFTDAAMQPVFTAAQKDKDDEVVFAAQLGLAALRDTAMLAKLLDRCRTEWDERRTMVAAVLPAARSEECGRAVAELIAKATPPVQAAGLRLLRYVATKEQAVIVRGYLSSEDHNIRKEAVNAMRALHGMEPIETLDAFQAINMAKEWLEK